MSKKKLNFKFYNKSLMKTYQIKTYCYFYGQNLGDVEAHF